MRFGHKRWANGAGRIDLKRLLYLLRRTGKKKKEKKSVPPSKGETHPPIANETVMAICLLKLKKRLNKKEQSTHKNRK